MKRQLQPFLGHFGDELNHCEQYAQQGRVMNIETVRVQDGSLLLQPEAASGSIRWSCRIPSSGGLSPRHVPAECRGS